MRAILFIALIAVFVPDRPDLSPKEKLPMPTPQQMLCGEWLLENKANNVVMHLRITPTETFFIMNGVVSEADGLTANCTFDFTKNPIHIDFMPKNRGGRMPGILVLEGDRMTLGINTGGDPRPTDFSKANLVGNYTRVRK